MRLRGARGQDPLWIEYKSVNENTDKANVLLGVELEVDGQSTNKNYFEYAKNMNSDRYVLKEDGSVNGFEVVTFPHTLQAYKDQRFMKDVILQLVKDGFKSHDTNTCGLHIHFNSTYLSDVEKYKLLLMFWKCKQYLIMISRRKKENILRWAKFIKPRDLSVLPYGINCLYRRNKNFHGRYTALNFLPMNEKNTIEIRIYRGTLNHETFKNTIKFTYYMLRFIKEYGVGFIYNAKPKMIWSALLEIINNNDVSLYKWILSKKWEKLHRTRRIRTVIPERLTYRD